MSSILVKKGIIRSGRVEVEEPIDLPDGTEVLVTSAASPDDDGPMSPAEVTRALDAMAKMEPFDMTPEEEAAIEAGRQQRKAYTLANMNKSIEGLFP